MICKSVLYKSVFIKDATGGMKLNLTYSGGLFLGDSIRINLKGVKLNDYGKQIQLDSIDLEKSVHKISSGTLVKPRKVTIKEFEITKIELPIVHFKVVCATGTYIRSLANDLGELGI